MNLCGSLEENQYKYANVHACCAMNNKAFFPDLKFLRYIRQTFYIKVESNLKSTNFLTEKH